MSTAARFDDPGEELAMTLHTTRKIRFALEVMWSEIDFLPDNMTRDPGVREALVTISHWLDKAEEAELRDRLLTRNYAVIRPVSLVNPPSAQSLADIKAAIGVLNTHALLIASDDDLAGRCPPEPPGAKPPSGLPGVLTGALFLAGPSLRRL
jgi:hypothetical protein